MGVRIKPRTPKPTYDVRAAVAESAVGRVLWTIVLFQTKRYNDLDPVLRTRRLSLRRTLIANHSFINQISESFGFYGNPTNIS